MPRVRKPSVSHRGKSGRARVQLPRVQSAGVREVAEVRDSAAEQDDARRRADELEQAGRELELAAEAGDEGSGEAGVVVRPAMSGDPLTLAAAELDQAEHVADQAPPVPGAAPPAPVDHRLEARQLLDVAGSILFPLYPSLERVYPENVRDRIAAAAAPVMEKYGLRLDDIFGRWAPELGLAFAVLPLVTPTLEAIRADRAAARGANDAASSSSSPPAAAATDGAPVAPDVFELHKRA